MSQSGNPRRRPGKPPGGPPPTSRGSGRPLPGGRSSQQPQFPSDGENGDMPDWTPNRPAQSNRQQEVSNTPREVIVPAEHIDPGRRGVALVIDILACYLVAMVVGSIPYVNHFLQINTVWLGLLLCKDYFFGGRGVGKNLMGLQVVDVTTGLPASLLQSFMRNIILLAPLIVLQTASIVLVIIPLSFVNQWIMNLINIVGMVYVAIVLPLESYRAYRREDSLRLGDEIAGTALIDAPMDFSEALPRN